MYDGYELDKDLKRSLHLVILAITFGVVFFTITAGSPLTGFARELGAGDFIYGVLMGLPVVGGVLQLLAAYILESTRKRKKIFLIGGLIQRLMWIPVALVPFIIPMGHQTLRIWSVILFVTISSMSGAFINVAFYSWMGDLVPQKIRGRYFSRRSRISTIASFFAGIGMGWFLDTVKGFTGYSIILFIAAVFGAMDILCFIWVKDPEMMVEEEKPRFFSMLKAAFQNRNYSRLVIFWTIWNFGVNVAGPFFNVYMLEYLKMGFLQISIFGQVASNIVNILFVTRWGTLIDRYGNKPVLFLCGISAATLPAMWIISAPGQFYIVPVINIIAGAVWCGMDLTSQNLLIGLSPDKNRSMFVAIFFMVTTLFGNALAFVAGGFFLEQMRPVVQHWDVYFMGQHLNQYHYLFILSSLIRLISILFFVPWIHEENSANVLQMLKVTSGRLGNKMVKRGS